MRLSISNIAWSSENDHEMYKYLYESSLDGLEIAPTRIFGNKPYECSDQAKLFAKSLKESYGLVISSMQSIWYGRSERIFGTDEERCILINYTKQAIDFAVSIDCGNLVFGCPKNRNMSVDSNIQIAYDFFSTIAKYSAENGVVIAFEPNPPIYGTNFINTTIQAFDFVRELNVKGLAVNVDFGAIIENGEDLTVIAENLPYINHIHISEPNLSEIKHRSMHNELHYVLKNGNYDKFVSIEMKNLDDVDAVKRTLDYVVGVFI